MDSVEEIKSRLSVEDVVGEYVELKRSGRNFKGLSPFSNERTPSFMVSPEKQIWHDFSSGKGGNIFSFVMDMEGVDFRGALEILARKAGVELTNYSQGDGSFKKRKDTVLEALELATKYYQQTLLKNGQALSYVTKSRLFNQQTVGQFRIGYSPNSGKALVDFLTKRGISSEIIKESGLSSKNYRGLSDMFRGRIMIPLTDAQGLPIGFTARLLQPNDDAPKYINTPQTVVYDKSRHVFGLSLAKDAIRRAEFVVIVEGNLDVIASHQAGVKNVVATAGTALTQHQLKILQRFTTDVRLCFDQDKAGIAAAERAIAVAQGVGIQLSIIDIPEGKDPDELIKLDPKKWVSALGAHKYAVDWLINKYTGQFDLKSANGKKQFTDVIFGVISNLPDQVEKDHYLSQLAKMLDISSGAIRSKFSMQKQPRPGLKKAKVTPQNYSATNDNIYEDQLLCLLVWFPITRRYLETEPGHLFFNKPERQQVYEFIVSNPQASFSQEIPNYLKDIEDYVKILVFKAEELYSKFDANERLIELRDLISKLTKDNKKEKQLKLHQEIKQAAEAGDTKKEQELLSKFNDLIKKDS
jgi:DNA primase